MQIHVFLASIEVSAPSLKLMKNCIFLQTCIIGFPFPDIHLCGNAQLGSRKLLDFFNFFS